MVQPADARRLRSRLARRYSFQQAIDLAEVVRDVADLLREGTVHVTHPRYFGLFNPSTREAGIIADAITAAFNPQLAVWSHAPAAQEIERHVLLHLGTLLGFDPDETAANFTTGGAEANLSAVLAALASLTPESCQHGVAGLSRPPAIYLTAQSHHSFVKIARMTGLGTHALREVGTTNDLLMDPVALRRQIQHDTADGWHPLVVVSTAGATATGHIDPLDHLAEVAAEFGVWHHVDAAWGAAAAFSPELRPLLAGIERADSVTWDAHKWLSVPMGAGMFFCRHPEALRRAFDVSTSYMPDPAGHETTDPYLTTCQWSRRAIGLKVFIALAEVGVEGYRHMIEHQTRMGELLRQRLGSAGWVVANRTRLPVICFSHPLIRAGETTTTAVLRTMYDRGRAWISDVSLRGREKVFRACITSYLTQPHDLEALISELDHALGRLCHSVTWRARSACSDSSNA